MLESLNLKLPIFGLNIKDSYFKIASLKKRGGILVPFLLIEKKIPNGVVENGVIKKEDVFIDILKKLFLQIKDKLKTKNTIVSLPETKSFSCVIPMPPMSKEELNFSVPLEAENYIPLPSEEMYIGFEEIKPVFNHLDHTDIFLAAVEKNLVNSYVSCLKKAGLVPVAFELETQSIVRTLIKNGEPSLPVVIIDIEKDVTIFISFYGNSLRFTSSIPFSLGKITKALSDSLGINLKEAEHMQEKYGLSHIKPYHRSKAVSRVINSALQEVISEIKKYIDFYLEHDFHEHLGSSKKKKTIEKIILVGEGATIKEIDKFLEKELNLKVEIGDVWINFSPKLKKMLSQEFQKKALSFATSIGLALAEKEIKN